MFERSFLTKELACWPERFGVSEVSIPAFKALLRLQQVVILGCEAYEDAPPLLRRLVATEDQTIATRDKVLQLAASMAHQSHSLVLSALVRSAQEFSLQLRELELDQLPGGAYITKMDRAWYLLGMPDQLMAADFDTGVSVRTLIDQMLSDGSQVYVLAQRQPKRILAIFSLARSYGSASLGLSEVLDQHGIRQVLLCQERHRTVEVAAETLRIALWRSELSTHEQQAVAAKLHEEVQGDSAVLRAMRKGSGSARALQLLRADATLVVPTMGALAPLITEAHLLARRTKRRYFWFKP